MEDSFIGDSIHISLAVTIAITNMRQYITFGNIPTHHILLVTVRNEVAKVMFLHVSVILSTGLGWGVCSWGCLLGGGGVPAQGVGEGGGLVSQHALRQTPPGRDGYCCGRYASYWNAFFFINFYLFTISFQPFQRNIVIPSKCKPQTPIVIVFSIRT